MVLVEEEMLTAIRCPYIISGGAVSVSDVRQDSGVRTTRQSAAATHATSSPLVRDEPLRLPLRQTPLKTLTAPTCCYQVGCDTPVRSVPYEVSDLVSCQRR
jgi:hypothetical protein